MWYKCCYMNLHFLFLTKLLHKSKTIRKMYFRNDQDCLVQEHWILRVTKTAQLFFVIASASKILTWNFEDKEVISRVQITLVSFHWTIFLYTMRQLHECFNCDLFNSKTPFSFLTHHLLIIIWHDKKFN